MSPPDAPRVLPGVATCAALLALALVNAAAVRTNDFRVFHTAGARVLAGEALYRSDDGQYPFKYAPVVGLLLAPVGALPLRTAKALWEVASAAALFLFLRHSARLQSPAPTRASGAVAFLLLLPYVWHLFSLGQIDGFLLAAIALSDRWGDRRPVPAGLLWALALLTKPPYLVFLAAALLGRQWPRLLALAGGLAAGLFAPALVWGWGANLAALRAWWGVLGASTPELLCAPSNQSLWAIACRYLGPGLGPALGVATLGTLALVVITVRSAFRARASARDTVTCACLAATALASPLGWWTNLVALAPLVGGLCATPARNPARRARTAAGLGVGLLAAVAVLTAELISRDAFVFWLNQRHYGLAGFVATLAALAVRPAADREPLRPPRA